MVDIARAWAAGAMLRLARRTNTGVSGGGISSMDILPATPEVIAPSWVFPGRLETNLGAEHLYTVEEVPDGTTLP